MPLSAIHPEHSVLDLTLEGLGCEGRITWEQIHRARPRVPLTCPECEWGLCPKVSPHGARPQGVTVLGTGRAAATTSRVSASTMICTFAENR